MCFNNIMRNSLIIKRINKLNELGGISEPEVSNNEWLYILKEETRNSILIEGIFISEKDLEDVLSKGNPLKKSQNEALNYFKTAKLFYQIGYEGHITSEYIFTQSILRQINKMLFEDINDISSGDFRKGDAIITGAKILPPSQSELLKWIEFYKDYVMSNITKNLDVIDYITFLCKQHILFEFIHPFIDGNGRTGRIILNYLLISKGLPTVIIKADDDSKMKYYKALEQGDRSLIGNISEFNSKKIISLIETMNVSLLETLISDSLRLTLDRIIINLLENKAGLKIKPSKEVAEIMNYSNDSIRTLINRGKFISVKNGKSWMTHESLYLDID